MFLLKIKLLLLKEACYSGLSASFCVFTARITWHFFLLASGNPPLMRRENESMDHVVSYCFLVCHFPTTMQAREQCAMFKALVHSIIVVGEYVFTHLTKKIIYIL